MTIKKHSVAYPRGPILLQKKQERNHYNGYKKQRQNNKQSTSRRKLYKTLIWWLVIELAPAFLFESYSLFTSKYFLISAKIPCLLDLRFQVSLLLIQELAFFLPIYPLECLIQPIAPHTRDDILYPHISFRVLDPTNRSYPYTSHISHYLSSINKIDKAMPFQLCN